MIETSKKVRDIFEKVKGGIDLQGFSSFPKGSCEGASLFLGVILKRRFPSSPILYVKGEDKDGASHYWLEADSLIYDITADQFTQLQKPIYGESKQPLMDLFPMLTKVPVLEALKISGITNETYKKSMVIDLEHYLNERA